MLDHHKTWYKTMTMACAYMRWTIAEKGRRTFSTKTSCHFRNEKQVYVITYHLGITAIVSFSFKPNKTMNCCVWFVFTSTDILFILQKVNKILEFRILHLKEKLCIFDENICVSKCSMKIKYYEVLFLKTNFILSSSQLELNITGIHHQELSEWIFNKKFN